MDQNQKILITMHQALHPRNDIEIYVSRKEEGRRLASTALNASTQELENYINNTKERLIITASNITGKQ